MQVVFIDHTQPELEDNSLWKEQHQSKVNQYEVDMVLAIVRYMYQQGYGPDKSRQGEYDQGQYEQESHLSASGRALARARPSARPSTLIKTFYDVNSMA